MTDVIASAERKRGSGVKMVYDLLRDGFSIWCCRRAADR